MSARDRIHECLFEPRTGWQRAITATLAILILVNITALMIETLPGLEPATMRRLLWLERISLGIFTFEYLLRLWSITADPRFATPLGGRLRWMVTPFAIFDLLAVLPGLLPLVYGMDLRSLRLLRLLRIIAFLRLGRYSRGLAILGRVVTDRRGELGAGLLIVVVLLALTSSLMYLLEHEAQPEVFSSIPHAMWWSIVTLTTVGYGDAAPVTAIGKVVGGMVALMGVGVAALPAGIIASGLGDALAADRAERAARKAGVRTRVDESAGTGTGEH